MNDDMVKSLDPSPLPAGLRLSQRGAIPPFIVMDVMQAAAGRAAEGHGVCSCKKAETRLEVTGALLDAVSPTGWSGWFQPCGLLFSGLKGYCW